MYWLGSRRHSSSRTIEARRRNRKCSPEFALLESRALLSTYLTVTSAANQGAGTLRHALASSQSGDTIVFAPQMQAKTIRLTSELEVNTNVNIFGLQSGGVTISAQGKSRDFLIDPGVQVTLQYLTLTGGKAAQGGAIEDFGGLDLFACVLRGNQATMGGAIFTEAPGSSTDPSLNPSTDTTGNLSVVDCQLVGNRAVAGPGQQASGGAIDAVSANIAVASSTLTGNTATGGSGGGNGLGGAIDAFLTVVNISGDTLARNKALGGSMAGSAFGGAVNIEDSPSKMSPFVPNQTTVIGDVFKQNLALGGKGGGNGLGGAVRVANDLSSSSDGVFIAASNFIGNQANGGSGSVGGYGAGGAIKLGSESGPDSTSTMTLDSDTLNNNSATGGNGTQQGGDGDGGAVDLMADEPSGTPAPAPTSAAILDALTPSRITASNSSGRNNGSEGGSGGGGGEGGVFHLGFGTADLEIDDGFYTGNSATGGPGTGRGGRAGGTGGAILLDSGIDTLQNVFVSGNEAMGTPKTFNGGRGGGVAMRYGSSLDSNAVITGNRAQSPDQNMFVQG